jgi:hypothetical protein
MTTLLLVFNLQAKEKHPIYNKIVKLKPTINKKFAMNLSSLVYKYSREYKQDPFISIAIAMQESSLRQRHRVEKVAHFTDKGYEIIRGYTDLCLFQIHISTAINYGMDLMKLNTNLEYCVEQHFKIMKKKRKICKKLGKDDWTCYHSMTEVLRLQYKKLVERYL